MMIQTMLRQGVLTKLPDLRIFTHEFPLRPLRPLRLTPLRIDAAHSDRMRHAVNRQHIRRNAVVDTVGLGVANHFLE